MKRKLQILCVALLALVFRNTPLFAEDFEVDGIYYNITSEEDKTVEVTTGSYKYSGVVTIPESVTNDGSTYSVISIGDYAFYQCLSLTSVVIGNSVTSIGYGAFSACSGLESIIVDEENTVYDSREDCNAIIKTSSNTLIAGCKSTIIPNSVTSIGYNAFYGCSGLTSVEIPNSVTSIGEGAFYYCSGLTSVEIPNSVTSIGYSAFCYCSGLTSVEIPNSVTSIEWQAFYGCSSLTSVVIPNSVTYIGVTAFEYCSSLTFVEIPNSVTSIGDYAFEYCFDLKTVTVGCSWKTNPLYDFGENVTVNATLHSYENGVCTVCGEGEFVEIELVEGTPFENDETREVAKVTYIRTLPNLKWNALYLPVEIPVAELSENYDVAYFNNMHAYDRNDDGTIDEMDMEIFLIKEGTLHANHPYFIRAKSEAARQLTVELTDVTLYSTDEASCTSITAASAYMNFELIGVYERCEAEELTGCYAINTSGAWSPIALGSYLNPFRFYLKMTSRNGSPVKVDEALKSIRIRLHGEEGTTGIDNMTINCPQTPAIYDLQGRRVSNPGRGMYIVNGKKVMIQ